MSSTTAADDGDSNNIEMENLNPKNGNAGGNKAGGGAGTATKKKENDLLELIQTSLNQVVQLTMLYKELYPMAFNAVVGVLAFLLVWMMIIHPLVRRSSVLKRNHMEKDYSDLVLHYNFKSANIDHYCLFGGDDKCNCEDPTESTSREDTAGWVKSVQQNKRKIQSLIDRGETDIDVVFLGDDIPETFNGQYMGKTSQKTYKIGRLFNDTFHNALDTSINHEHTVDDAGGKFSALSLGVTGDRTTNLFWRLKHGEMAGMKQIEPKVFWLMTGTNDLVQMGCSEEVVTLGILRVAEEIAFHNPFAVIVIQAIMPRSYQSDGKLKRSATYSSSTRKWGGAGGSDKQPQNGVVDLYGDRNRNLQIPPTSTTTTGTTVGMGTPVTSAATTTTSAATTTTATRPTTTTTSTSGTTTSGTTTATTGTTTPTTGTTPVSATSTVSGTSPVSATSTSTTPTTATTTTTTSTVSGTTPASTTSTTGISGGAGSAAGGTSSAANFVSGTSRTSTTTTTSRTPATPGSIRTPISGQTKDERMQELLALRQKTLEKYQNKPLAVGAAKPGGSRNITSASTAWEKRQWAKEQYYKNKSPMERPDYMREFWPSIQQINKEIELFCKKHDHFVYYDASQLFIGSVGNEHYQQKTQQIIGELMPDYIHMSYGGYKLYTEKIVKELQRIIYDDDETNDIETKGNGRRNLRS